MSTNPSPKSTSPNTNPTSLGLRPQSFDQGEQWRVVDRFDTTYWSGLDVRIYLNNIRIEEAIQMSYQILEPVRPYYHYSDYVARRMVGGQRIVAGDLTLNFKKDGYLFSLLSALRENENLLPGTKKNSNSPIPTTLTQYGPFSSKIATDLKNGKYTGQVLSKLVKDSKDRNLFSETNDRYPANVFRDRPMFYTNDSGFDISVIYGAQIKSEQVMRYLSGDSMEPDISKADEPKINNKIASGLKIIGASIGGISKTIADDGRPIMETYTFQARDIQILTFEDLQT